MEKLGETTLSDSFKNIKLINDVKKKYKGSAPFQLENYELITSPFRVLKLTNLISDQNYLEQLTKDVRELEYNRKDNDLYNLQQSNDLNKCNVESITQFKHLLRSKVEPLLSNIMGVTFNATLSISASLYKTGNYLLCHDDKCDDRCVAFVYYLTEDSTDEPGGEFRMFEHDEEDGQPAYVTRTIRPVKNSFICFEVGNYTYHEVNEVLAENFERLSINGWFHSDNLNTEALNYTDPLPPFCPQTSDGTFRIEEVISQTYLSRSNLIQAQEQFANDSFIMLPDFFVPDFYQPCCEYLNSINHSWYEIGPANRRSYECMDLDEISHPLKGMVDFIRSPIFISYLKDITDLDLVPLTRKTFQSLTRMSLEVQRWRNGAYTMATDNDEFFKLAGLDLFIFFNSNSFIRGENNFGGCTTYLAVGQSDSESVTSDGSDDNGELLTIEPQDNALVLVYRTADNTVRFTKYINKFNSGCYHAISATFFQYRSTLYDC